MTLIYIAVFLGLFAGSVYAVWRANEEKKAAQAQQQRFDAFLKAQSESRERITRRAS